MVAEEAADAGPDRAPGVARGDLVGLVALARLLRRAAEPARDQRAEELEAAVPAFEGARRLLYGAGLDLLVQLEHDAARERLFVLEDDLLFERVVAFTRDPNLVRTGGDL